MLLKHPELTDGAARSKVSCKTVSEVFLERPWVLNLWETEQNGKDDVAGYDMFVRVKSSFSKVMKMGGDQKLLPVQIKSSDRRIRTFLRKYDKLHRFFNTENCSHQFILCGMDDKEYVLADLIGQIVVHAAGFGLTEKGVLSHLESFGDRLAVEAYLSNKCHLVYGWYGYRLSTVH